ncbi:MAG: DUF423 domain-containing protein [Gemmatimonadaceae bacterium]|nr:DUF423 domain-containing protein [Chitinophagaceae bacterium]
MHRGFLITATLLGALSVALGAFAAHGLRQLVTPETAATFETGVRYQFYHTFALFIVGILYEKLPVSLLRWAGKCFLAGILLFSGSLYLLTAMKATDMVGLTGIGLITPFGGLFFIAGWTLLMVAFIKKL